MKLIRAGEVVGQGIQACGAAGPSVRVLRNLMAATALAVALVGGVARAAAKGALAFAGGERRFGNAPVWSRFVQLAGGKGAPVVVMPTAAENPTKSGQATVENLVRYGARAEMVLIAPMLKDY